MKGKNREWRKTEILLTSMTKFLKSDLSLNPGSTPNKLCYFGKLT